MACSSKLGTRNFAELQSEHAACKIVAFAVIVRLDVGTNYQGADDLDWGACIFARFGVLANKWTWGLHGLSLENEIMSGIMRESVRPVLGGDDREKMKAFEAFRGSAEDYRVSDPLVTNITDLSKLYRKVLFYPPCTDCWEVSIP